MPLLVQLMIVSDRINNKSKWLKFVEACEESNVLIEVVVHEKNMFKCIVGNQWNFMSRFSAIPETTTPYSVRTVYMIHAKT